MGISENDLAVLVDQAKVALAKLNDKPLTVLNKDQIKKLIDKIRPDADDGTVFVDFSDTDFTEFTPTFTENVPGDDGTIKVKLKLEQLVKLLDALENG